MKEEFGGECTISGKELCLECEVVAVVFAYVFMVVASLLFLEIVC